MLALIIMDGFGLSKDVYGNAISESGTPFLKSLLNKYPHSMLGASGEDVGLPNGQMGNSEVGHLNIGAGRIVYQELTRITKAIKDGSFYENEVLLKTVREVKKSNKALHTYGLLSDGGVHSHIEQLYGVINLAKKEGLDNIYIHCFMDGRDVSPTSGLGFLKQLDEYTKKIGFGTIASVMGRYYAMDRDKRWQRVEEAYRALADGEGVLTDDIYETVKASYAAGVTDEFIKPIVVCKNGEPIKRIDKGDGIIFFNFRPDRAREITEAFTFEDFSVFPRKKGCLNPIYTCLTQYDATFKNVSVAFMPQALDNNLGQILSENGLRQLRIAETEKYAHVTFFFNSGVEEPNPLEDRVLIPSPKVDTYDQKPEMSAYEVADEAVKLIKERKYDVMILNFANCDMVGHTGDYTAAVKAVTAVDNSVKKVVEAILSVGGSAIITADHGNAERMYEADGSPFTAHTINPVPVILVKEGAKGIKEGGKLCDLAPTMLSLLGIEIPKEMTGVNLAF